jgi:hypothetical protein
MANRKPWKPTIAQLETIAEMSHAKVPVEAIARAVGLSPRAFLAWQARLANAAAREVAKPAPAVPVPEVFIHGEKSEADRAIAAHFK